ncbi:MAG: deoxyribonuclease IV [Kiritimatiellaeota bacterium]|nr:deoxyribonuclease IV [Kiritimatiellota bacterium]
MDTSRRYFIGPHVSAGGGAANAALNAHALGATGFALFVKNQRQWSAPPLTPEDTRAFAAQMQACGYTPEHVLPHAGYLINLANPDDAAQERSLASLINEMQRCAELGLDKLNFHPGSHLKLLSPQDACARVAAAINRALAHVPGITLVVENTAGSGGMIGARFEELRMILDGVDDRSRLGFCLDTAHAFAAGHGIQTRDGFLAAMDAFDASVGMAHLRGMHLNDSRSAFNSHADRHESLGDGLLGLAPFKCVMQDGRFANMPLIIETPDPSRWTEEIRLLLSFAQ